MTDPRGFNAGFLAGAQREQRLQAEELHNTLCQSLAGTSLLVKLLVRRIETGRKIEAAEVDRISKCLDEAIDDARAPIRVQGFLAEETGLANALAHLARITTKRIPCRFGASGEVRLADPQVARVLYRIAREAIGTILAHANAGEIAISLMADGGLLTMEVRSDGRAASHPSENTLQESDFLQRYADAAGIELTVVSPPAGGASIRCRVPLKPEKARKSRPPRLSK